MSMKFVKVAAAAAVFLAASAGVVLAAAPVVEKPIEAKIGGLPFGCDTTNLAYVIDSGNGLMCNGKAELVGPGWKPAGWSGLVQNNYFYVTRDTENGTEKSTWLPTITVPGYYEVWVSFRGTENRTSAAPFYVFTDSNVTYRIPVDQRAAEGVFSVKLGTFFFKKHALAESPRATGLVVCQSESPLTSEAVDGAFVRYVGPGTPTGLVASDAKSTDEIEVSWKPVAGARAYKVFRNTVNSTTGATEIATVNAPAVKYKDTPLNERSRFFYWVKAVGALGRVSGFSNVDDGRTGFTPPVPTTVKASDGTSADSIVVTWKAVASATSYKVYRGTTDVAADAQFLANATAPTYTNSGLPAGQSYYYFVTALNAIAESARSLGDQGSTAQ